MRKIKSGIFGLNALLDGGINENSTSVVIGASGAGKTTFATQYIKRGLETGQLGIFVSLDENKEQIIREAVEMGWHEIHDYLDNDLLVFIDASGKEFSGFIKKELPGFVEEWTGSDARVVIDPLTPVIWSTDDRYEQRELLAFLLKETRKIGTVLCTLEEHSTVGDLGGYEVVIPMYLADCVIHLRHTAPDDAIGRSLRIIKCRSSRHSRLPYKYRIIGGLGIMIDSKPLEKQAEPKIPRALAAQLEEASRLSSATMKRFTGIMDRLKDEDFEGLELDNVVQNILNEYGES